VEALAGLTRVRGDGADRHFLEIGSLGTVRPGAITGDGRASRFAARSVLAGARPPYRGRRRRDEGPQAFPQAPLLLRHHISSHCPSPPPTAPRPPARTAALPSRASPPPPRTTDRPNPAHAHQPPRVAPANGDHQKSQLPDAAGKGDWRSP